MQGLWNYGARWYTLSTAQGRLGWQLTLNSFMLSGLIWLHHQPWLLVGLLLLLVVASAFVHGWESLTLLLIYGALGWLGEAWMTSLGGVWAHAAPVGCGLTCGGLLGVPFFMIPAWGLVGAMMLAMAGYWAPKLRD